MSAAPSRVGSIWPRLQAFTRRAPHQEAGFSLYEAIVAQARSEAFYRTHGVPDTVHGRFEMTVLHVTLVLARLGLEGDDGQGVGRAMLEAFVADMDDACRRLGIGDMGVPRQVKKATAAVLERGHAYRAAMASEDQARADGADGKALAEVLGAEIWRDAPDGARGGAVALAAYVRRAISSLERQAGAALLAGTVSFPDARAPQGA